MRELALVVTAVWLVLATAIIAAQSAARPITLSWDANPEPDVLGYVVHVGNGTAKPNEHYDVGNATSFVFAGAVPGRRYYFTVSAYTVAGVEGPPSEEVSAIAGIVANAAALNGQARVRFQSAGTLSAVTALQDGRLLLIENDRSIRMLSPASSLPQTVLHELSGKAFSEIVVNGRFLATHHIFVGVIARQDAETNEFSVVRYREVNGTLGEGATVISGLQFGGTRIPRFAVDDEERIYVAMPATASTRSDPYAGNILRFNADGTVPKENRAASPVFARGFSEPANLGWNGSELVALGSDEQWSYTAARLDPDLPATNWPRRLEPISVGTSASLVTAGFGLGPTATSRGMRAFVDASQRLFRLTAGAEGAHQPMMEQIALPAGSSPVAVAAGFDGQIHVIVRSTAGQFLLLEATSPASTSQD